MALKKGVAKILALLQNPKIGQAATVLGWVRNKRESKAGIAFLEINDGSCFESLQAVIPVSYSGYQQQVPQLYPGTSVRVRGTVSASQGGKQKVELQTESLEILGHSDPLHYPIAKQKMTYEH